MKKEYKYIFGKLPHDLIEEKGRIYIRETYEKTYMFGLLTRKLSKKGSLFNGDIRVGYERRDTYKNGYKVRVIQYWGNSLKKSETFFKEGVGRCGMYRVWYKNGQLKYEVETHKTHNVGLKKEWYENGQLRSESIWKANPKNFLKLGNYGDLISKKCWDKNGNVIKKCKDFQTEEYEKFQKNMEKLVSSK